MRGRLFILLKEAGLILLKYLLEKGIENHSHGSWGEDIIRKIPGDQGHENYASIERLSKG